MRLRFSQPLALAGVLGLSACGRTGVWALMPEESDGGEAGESSGGRGGRGGASGSGGSAGKGECTVSSDCPLLDPCAPPVCVLPTERGEVARCVAEPLDCDDGNPCTLDACDAVRGACTSTAPSDADGDGALGKPPAGAPAACGGDDCDDADAAVHPGAAERCNARDDDCDGAIDDGATYQVGAAAPVPLALDMDRSQHGGIVWNGETYAATYTYSSPSFHKQSYFVLLDPSGQRSAPAELVSEINADTYAGPVGWSGQTFLTAWSDARQAGNYEVYFTRFDTTPAELSADQRVTDAPDFSVRPSLRFDGSGYLMIWDDHRGEQSGGAVGVYGRRVSSGGVLLGDEVRLTPALENAEYGALAVGSDGAAIAYVVNDGDDYASARFRSFDLEFGNSGRSVELSADAQDPSIARVGERYVVAWHTGSQARNWGNAVQAALVERDGVVLAAGPVTSGDVYAKWRTLVSLGDRVLLIWSGAGPDGLYALYFELLSAQDLSVIVPRQLLATSSRGGMLVDPIATLGPDGDIGVLYDDNRSGQYTAYFTRLTCGLSMLP